MCIMVLCAEILTENREIYSFEPVITLNSWLAKTANALPAPSINGICALQGYPNFWQPWYRYRHLLPLPLKSPLSIRIFMMDYKFFLNNFFFVPVPWTWTTVMLKAARQNIQIGVTKRSSTECYFQGLCVLLMLTYKNFDLLNYELFTVSSKASTKESLTCLQQNFLQSVKANLLKNHL